MQWITRIFAGLLCMPVAVAVSAQVTQPGIVQEYNERAAKTSLAGVELDVRSAGSTVSAIDGHFALDFPTLKAGDRVILRSAEKLGYEIFNKEAVEQWNINPRAPFAIVMCRSDRFKRIRDNYERHASDNYRAQYSRERAAIDKLRDEGKVKDEEYRRRLAEIQENYDRQLDNLDNYVDRFARIDLSELSAEEQEIIELVQAGRFDEAIARYDNLKLADKLVETIKQEHEISAALRRLSDELGITIKSKEDLYAAVGRQVETLMLAGGIENNRSAADIMMKVADADTLNIDWQLRTGLHMQDYMADYPAALRYFEQALRSSLYINGEENEQTANAYNDIGLVNYNQGQFDKALDYYDKALTIRVKQLGSEHPDVAVSYTNIGTVYCMQGNYDMALDYYDKALTLRERLFGAEHPDVALSYDNIGSVYSYKGRYDKALEYLEKALTIFVNTIGAEHPDVAASYNNIGFVYSNQRLFEKALENYEKALTIWEKALGAEHPNVAAAYNNIGSVYSDQRNYAKSLEYLEKALTIQVRLLGAEHPNVATSYNNIGFVYYNQRLFEKALENYEKALTISEKALGAEHPDVATSYNNIGTVYSAQGNYDKALEYLEKALTIWVNTLGAEHPNVARTYNNIGFAYLRQGNYDKALEYYGKALMIREKIFGANSPVYIKSLATAYSHYIEAVQHDSKFEEAFKTFMSDKAVVAGFTDDASGLDGEYYLLEFNDWNVLGTNSIFDKAEKCKELPKNVTVMKEDNISACHFDNQTDITISIKQVGAEEKARIEAAYKKWKEAR